MLATHQEREQEHLGIWESPSGRRDIGGLLRGLVLWLATIRPKFLATIIGISIGAVSARLLFETENPVLILTILLLNTAFLCGLGAFALLSHD